MNRRTGVEAMDQEHGAETVGHDGEDLQKGQVTLKVPGDFIDQQGADEDDGEEQQDLGDFKAEDLMPAKAGVEHLKFGLPFAMTVQAPGFERGGQQEQGKQLDREDVDETISRLRDLVPGDIRLKNEEKDSYHSVAMIGRFSAGDNKIRFHCRGTRR
jgi:hypothetical protein